MHLQKYIKMKTKNKKTSIYLEDKTKDQIKFIKQLYPKKSMADIVRTSIENWYKDLKSLDELYQEIKGKNNGKNNNK